MTKRIQKTRDRPKAEKIMHQIALRLDADLIAEIDGMIADLKDVPFIKVERSTVLRMALSEGWPTVRAQLKKQAKK